MPGQKTRCLSTLTRTISSRDQTPSSSAAGIVGDDKLLLIVLASFSMLAISIFAAIWIWPAPNVARRVVGMLADAGTVTFALSLVGESGVGLVGVYLFI